MEFLKSIFGDKALTYDAFSAALAENKDVKLANLASGEYVDRGKYAAREQELAAANETIRVLRERVAAFDGVDVEGLKTELQAMQTKYDADIAAIKKDSAVSLALANAKAKNVKAVKALLNMDAITVNGDVVEGLADQLEKVRTENEYLFEAATPPAGIEVPTEPAPAKKQNKAYLDDFYKNNPFYRKE